MGCPASACCRRLPIRWDGSVRPRAARSGGCGMIQAVVSAGSRPSCRGELARTTVPCGRGTARGPKLVTHCQPPGRRKCSTCPLVPGIHSRLSAACSLRRQLSACRYRAKVEAESCSCASTLSGPNQAGWGRCAASAPNPKDGPSAVQGSGTRQPSRPFSAPPDRRKAGSCDGRRECPRPRAGRVPPPGRGRPTRAAPASAGWPPGPAEYRDRDLVRVRCRR